MKFESLLQSEGRLPEEQQNWAKENLVSRIQESFLKEYRRDKSVLQQGVKILLIIASYSLEDLKLLDKLQAVLANLNTSMIDIYVYDATNIKSMEDLNSIIPEIGNAYQTPMIGIWEDGLLKQSVWGYDGKKVLLEKLNLE